jgi:hypothetical protein
MAMKMMWGLLVLSLAACGGTVTQEGGEEEESPLDVCRSACDEASRCEGAVVDAEDECNDSCAEELQNAEDEGCTQEYVDVVECLDVCDPLPNDCATEFDA